MSRRRRSAAAACGALTFCGWLASAAVPNQAAASRPERAPLPALVPRAVLAIYNSAYAASPRETPLHTLAEMPLNHLGLVVRYHDIQRGVPAPDVLVGTRGILTWFESEASPDPRAYLAWLDRVVASGRRVVIIGRMGAAEDEEGTPTPLDAINRVAGRLGWRVGGGWLTTTHGARFHVGDERIFRFERPLPRVALPYARVMATAPDAKVLLRIGIDGRPGTQSDLAIVTPRGAWVAPGYAVFTEGTGDRQTRAWYLNPFEFFREAFQTDDVPKADATTVSGRRLYYSHVDGDGWQNLTRIEPYKSRYAPAARVVLERIVRAAPDLPVTIAPVVGDLDREWHGTSESLAVARELFAEPQVEAAIHTYSHPFDWGAFDPAQPATSPEAPVQRRRAGPDVTRDALLAESRAYAVRPFSLALELDQASAFVNGLLPRGKRVSLVQWSGDTRPFEAALARARALGLANINGGDTRFDREFPSSAWVSPLGYSVGRQLQVYASNSNENTYTDLWHDRFFGFSFLTATVRNTGLPRRLKPFNLYYHMYSGERLSSLNAVLSNLAHARTMSLAPIEASRFSRLVLGFRDVAFEPLGDRAWRVRDRGALQTVRFDYASLDAVHFGRSRGVVGQRHELGSLFVTLDEADAAPVVALKRVSSASHEPREPVVYLIDARWRVFDLRRAEGETRFVAAGYGPGEFAWQWPGAGPVAVRWRAASGQTGQFEAPVDATGVLRIRLPQLTAQRVEVTLTAVGGAPDVR